MSRNKGNTQTPTADDMEITRDLKGHEDYYRALKWIERNPQAWGRIRAKASYFARQGKHFSVRYLMEWARLELPVVEEGEQFKYPNELFPAFSRILIKQNPEVRQYISVRPARVDRAINGGKANR